MALSYIGPTIWSKTPETLKQTKYLNTFKHTLTIKCQCCPHIETTQLICTANQLTGFYMRATLARTNFFSLQLFSSFQVYSTFHLGDKSFQYFFTLISTFAEGPQCQHKQFYPVICRSIVFF